MPVASQPATAMQPPRSWFRRNWKWFLPGMLAVAVAMAGIAVFSYVQIRSYRYRQNPAYQMALAAVQDSDKIRDRLGEPIVDADWNPQGAIELRDNATIGEARFNFTVSGPNGYADVGTEARMVDAEWALTGLEVLFPDGDRVRLTEEVLAKQEVDTPEFDPDTEPQRREKKQDQTKQAPGPEVKVEVPDVPPGIK